MVRIMCDAKPQSMAGRRLAYHAITGGFVLAEVLRSVTGKDVAQLVDEEIRAPLGLKTFTYGVPPSEVDDVAPNIFTGPVPAKPYNWLLERSFGVKVREAVQLSNDPRFVTAVIPSANLYSTAEEACRFFELLLREGALGDAQIFSPKAVRRALVADLPGAGHHPDDAHPLRHGGDARGRAREPLWFRDPEGLWPHRLHERAGLGGSRAGPQRRLPQQRQALHHPAPCALVGCRSGDLEADPPAPDRAPLSPKASNYRWCVHCPWVFATLHVPWREPGGRQTTGGATTSQPDGVRVPCDRRQLGSPRGHRASWWPPRGARWGTT